jgi:hypothetical protein
MFSRLAKLPIRHFNSNLKPTSPIKKFGYRELPNCFKIKMALGINSFEHYKNASIIAEELNFETTYVLYVEEKYQRDVLDYIHYMKKDLII